MKTIALSIFISLYCISFVSAYNNCEDYNNCYNYCIDGVAISTPPGCNQGDTDGCSKCCGEAYHCSGIDLKKTKELKI